MNIPEYSVKTNYNYYQSQQMKFSKITGTQMYYLSVLTKTGAAEIISSRHIMETGFYLWH